MHGHWCQHQSDQRGKYHERSDITRGFISSM